MQSFGTNHAHPSDLADTLRRHFGDIGPAIRYAEQIARWTGPLAADYATAARLLRAQRIPPPEPARFEFRWAVAILAGYRDERREFLRTYGPERGRAEWSAVATYQPSAAVRFADDARAKLRHVRDVARRAGYTLAEVRDVAAAAAG